MRKKKTRNIKPIILLLLLIVIIAVIVINIVKGKESKKEIKIYYDIGIGKIELLENNVPTVTYDATITWEGTDKKANLSDSKNDTEIDNNYILNKSGTYKITVGKVTRTITINKKENKENMITISNKSRGQTTINFDKNQVENAKILYENGTEEIVDISNEITITTKGNHSIMLNEDSDLIFNFRVR